MTESAAMPTSVAPPAIGAPVVRVYRSATADGRGRVIVLALIAWVLAHVLMGGIVAARTLAMQAAGGQPPLPPEAPVWFSLGDLQIGVRAFEQLGSTFLVSVAWQLGGCILFMAGLVILLTQRLRIIALVFPVVLLAGSAVLQCIAYNVFRPYWAQGNPIFTLAFAGVCLLATARHAPRNSGWRELRTMCVEFLRQLVRNPFAQLFGPIFGKEMRVMGRGLGTYWVRTLYPLGLLALVSLVYFATTARIDMYSGSERIQRLQEIAPALTLYIAWAQYLLLLLLAAAYTSAAVCDERRTRTLASLMTTPMTATQIIMGKLSSRLVQLLIIGLVSVPFLLGIRVFGGLEATAIFALIAITITSTFLMAALGILASVWSRKPASAAAFAILLFLLVTMGPMLVGLIAMFGLGAGGRGGPPMELFAFSSPMVMFVTSMYVTGGMGGVPFSLRDMWITNALANLVLGMGAISLASVCLRGVMLSEKALEAPARRSRRARKRSRAAAPVPVVAADGAPVAEVAEEKPVEEVVAAHSAEVSDRPVLWRELRQPAVGSRRMLIIATCVLAVLILWLYSELPPWEEEPHAIVSIVGMLLLTIQAAIGTTPSIASEKDAQTWQTLLTTPLKAGEILVPKLLGSLKRMWFACAVIGGELLIGVFAGVVHPVIFLHLGMIALTVGIFLGGTGLYLSLVAKKGSVASILNIFLAGSLWAGLPIGGAILSELILRQSIGRVQWLEDVVFAINPIAMAVAAAMGSIRDRQRTWSAWSTELADTDMTLFTYTLLLTVVCAIGIALGLAALGLACRRFNRLAGRTS